MRQNAGSVRPAHQDRRVKPNGAVMQGPKRPRRCTPPNPGATPPAGTGVRLIHRTVVYGPIRTVVWEGRSREASPYPDCAEHDRQLGGGSPLSSLMVAKGNVPADVEIGKE